jgi:hypothetical protein
LARELLHAHGLANGIGRAKQVSHDGLAEHTHLADVSHVIVREGGAVGQAPAPDRQVGGSAPAYLGGLILVVSDDLDV